MAQLFLKLGYFRGFLGSGPANGFLLADPESAVLPLDEPPLIIQRAKFYHAKQFEADAMPLLRLQRQYSLSRRAAGVIFQIHKDQ